ncbi:hypothetical protein F5X68DRAFT_210018 [Plectosphaerella plurivora]|uniref:Pentatricopeptide repeat-containing protein n=1 Tax=Plectosphaerella plurivora TaxID=936078 RepID=A0A9P9A7F6_9PEZI|nr:hypothetical protein F5X68DRAFT_210018 [Plectosphaerella plurivora]
MSQRAVFRDLQSRHSFICQSCLSALSKPTPAGFGIRHNSSQASRLKAAVSRPRRGLGGSSSQLPIGTRTTPGDAPTDNKAAAALLQKLSEPNNEATFNFFDKDEKGVQKLDTKDAFADVFSGRGELREEVKANFSQSMRELLSDVKQDGSLSNLGIGDPEAMVKEIEAELGTMDDPEAFQEKLNAYINHLEEQLVAQGEVLDHYENMDPEAVEDGAEFVPKARKPQSIPNIPTDVWTINQRKRISKLNSVMERVFREMRRREETTAKTILSVWKSYNLARQTLAKSWSHVPNSVWDLIWKIFSIEADTNPNRFTYLSLLARDMSEAKVALNPEQQLITIEALFVEGFEAKAIENWKRCMSGMGDSGSNTFNDYWELGTRMFCQSGDLVQAERAVNKLLEQQADPHILMPFIRACATQTSEEAQEKAWASYRRLRELLGADMGLEEYDEVIAFFLTTNQTERALFAFVDMMTSGTVDLYAGGRLPSHIGNKFFFGKWLKRLIGAEDLDGAFTVFEFMRSKGIEAAPVQINGLIGAWQRAGGADDLQKADDLAWDMIRARIDFVQTRRLWQHPGGAGAVRLARARPRCQARLAHVHGAVEDARRQPPHDRVRRQHAGRAGRHQGDLCRNGRGSRRPARAQGPRRPRGRPPRAQGCLQLHAARGAGARDGRGHDEPGVEHGVSATETARYEASCRYLC